MQRAGVKEDRIAGIEHHTFVIGGVAHLSAVDQQKLKLIMPVVGKLHTLILREIHERNADREAAGAMLLKLPQCLIRHN